MSLNDNYLKEQITNFRKEIKNVYWVKNASEQTNQELQKWVWKNKIHVLEITSWTEFWETIDKYFPEQNNIIDGWLYIVSNAISIINDAYETERLIEGMKETMMMNQSHDIEKINYQLLRYKAGFLENGIVFSESLNSPMVISEIERSQLIKTILKKLAVYQKAQPNL